MAIANMVIMAATTKLRLGALVIALALPACAQHAGAPAAHNPNVTAKSTADIRRAQAEIKTGVRAYKHHALKIALSHFNRALVLDSRSNEARYDRGITETDLRAYGRAAADLQAVVKAQPHWTQARLHLAAAQFRAHQFAAASKNFDLLIRSNPKAGKLWLDDGVSYYQLHRYADARKRFARALALAPKSGRAHFWLGLSYARLGQKTKSRSELALAAHSRDVIVRTAAKRALTTR